MSEAVDEYGLPLDYPGSNRTIKHIVPLDGTTHDMVECFCHPSIVESNGWAGLAGLEDLAVQSAEPGELIFTHTAAAPTSRWEIRLEADGD